MAATKTSTATKTSSTTRRKSTTSSSRTTKSAAAAAVTEAPAAAAEVPAAAATPDAPEATVKTALKLRGLIERVTTASGAKKKDVKPIVEATLAELGRALSAGEELNLPPLGKAKVNRQSNRNGVDMLIVKVNRGGPKADAKKDEKEGVAEDDADS